MSKFFFIYAAIGVASFILMTFVAFNLFNVLDATSQPSLMARNIFIYTLWFGIPTALLSGAAHIEKSNATKLREQTFTQAQTIEYNAIERIKDLEQKLQALRKSQMPNPAPSPEIIAVERKEEHIEKKTSEDAFKQGVKYGLALALKQGVIFKLKANGSTVIDVDGLKFEIIGTAKEVSTENKKEKEKEEDYLEIVDDEEGGSE